MKKCHFLCILLLGISITLQSKERVIEHPAYITRNTDILEIDKIVQNDTATILHFKAFFYPGNWISISKKSHLLGDDGIKYNVKSMVGIEANKRFYMPESGETEFQIIFPPLPNTVSRIDFTEGDGKNSWDIWGIELKSNKLPKLVLPKHINTAKADKNTTLQDPVFEQGKAKLKGQILEYRPRMSKTLKLYISSCISVTTRAIDVDIAEDGTFSAELPVVTTTPVVIDFYGQPINFYLAPGNETIVYINQREITRNTSKLRKVEKAEGRMAYFDGYMSGISNELIDLYTKFKIRNDYDQLFKDAAGKTVEELRDGFLRNRKERLADIDTYKMSPPSKAILKGDVTLLTLENINMCPAIFGEAHIRANKLSREEAEKFYETPPTVPEDFYDIGFKDFTEINSPQLMYCNMYAGTVSNPYMRERISKATGINSGFFFDMGYLSEVIQQIGDFQPATDEQLAQIATYDSPIFLDIVKEKNETLFKTIEANKKKTGFKMNEVGEVTNEDLFPSFIAPFKGKVILVDFWATWCGPCLMANKEMKPMKDELKDEDIVYLYIAGDNSPKQTWENMIPDIAGEHFRVNREQWGYLATTFGVRGVPTYLVVNKEGEITYKEVGFPGVNKMKEELKKQLKKE